MSLMFPAKRADIGIVRADGNKKAPAFGGKECKKSRGPNGLQVSNLQTFLLRFIFDNSFIVFCVCAASLQNQRQCCRGEWRPELE